MAQIAVRGIPTSVARIPLRRAGGSLRQRSVTTSANMNMQDSIKATTASAPVVIYSKTYCPCAPQILQHSRLLTASQVTCRRC